MSTFEDDVEPLEETRSRGSTPYGRGAPGPSSPSLRKREREESPEPDEELETSEGKHSMWLVKVPRFLLEGWTKVDEEDKKLGTVRVYDADHTGHQRMELLLPPHPEPAIPLPPSHPYLATNYPRKYDLRLTSEQGANRVRNLYAFRERMEGGEDDDDDIIDSDGEDDQKGKGQADEDKSRGRRVVSMVGTIENEAALKPQITGDVPLGGLTAKGKEAGISPEYREVLRKRKLEASKPRHSVKVLDEGDASRANMLTSGVGSGFTKTPKGSFIAQKPKSAQTEKFTRMPRNELMDALFEAFEQYPYWSIKGLRARLEQPEVYLREVLSGIADLHKRGPYTGNWSLKAEYQAMRQEADRAESERRNAQSVQQAIDQSQASGSGVPQDTNDDIKEEDDDNNLDMDEVI